MDNENKMNAARDVARKLQDLPLTGIGLGADWYNILDMDAAEPIIAQVLREVKIDVLREAARKRCPVCTSKEMPKKSKTLDAWFHYQFQCYAGFIYDMIAEIEKN